MTIMHAMDNPTLSRLVAGRLADRLRVVPAVVVTGTPHPLDLAMTSYVIAGFPDVARAGEQR